MSKNKFFKRLTGLMTGLVVFVSSVGLVPVSAAETELLNEKFGADFLSGVVDDGMYAWDDTEGYINGTKWGALERGDALTNVFSVDESGVLWMRNTQIRPGNGNEENGISHRFTPITDGETLTFSAVLNLKNPAGLAEYNIRLLGDVRETPAVTMLRAATSPSENNRPVLGDWVYGGTLGTASSTNLYRVDETEQKFITANDGNFNFESENNGLTGDSYLTVTLSPDSENADKYKAKTVLRGSNQKYTAESLIDKETVLGLKRVRIWQLNNAHSEYGLKELGVKSLKITKSDGATVNPTVDFGDIMLDSNSVRLEQDMSEFDINGLGFTYESEYTDGKMWSIVDMNRRDDFYSKDENGVLWVKNPIPLGGENNSENCIARRFNKISDGETLKASAVLNIKEPGYNSEYHIRLIRDGAANRDASGNFATDSVTLLRIKSLYGEGAWGSTLGIQNYTQPYVNDSTEKIFIIPEEGDGTPENQGDGGFFKFGRLDGESYLTVTLTPDSEDNASYKATTVLTNNGKEYKAESKIAKDIVLGLDKLQIFELNFGKENTNVLGIKSIKVEAYDAAKKLSASDDNIIYVPYRNTTGHANDIALIAAICSKSDNMQQRYFIDGTAYKNFTAAKDNLELNIGKVAADEYVRLFIFDSFDNLRPLSTVKETGK